jgi:long-chain acyl-CoA synthetase
MVHGDRRPYLTALVTLNEENVRAWAKERGIAAGSVADLAKRSEVRQLVQGAVDALNAREPSYSTIKKFEILPSDLSQETGELTPTLKVKRKFTTEKYRALLDAMYG